MPKSVRMMRWLTGYYYLLRPEARVIDSVSPINQVPGASKQSSK